MSIEIHWGPAFSATTASLYTLWAKLSGSAKFQPFHKVRLTINTSTCMCLVNATYMLYAYFD